MHSERILAQLTEVRFQTTAVIFLFLASYPAGSLALAAEDRPGAPQSAAGALSGVPLNFEINQGQTDAPVRFLSHGDGYSVFLTSSEAVFKLRTQAGFEAAPSILRMEFLKSNRAAQTTGVDKLPGVANYYIGNDPGKWRSGIATYRKVKFQGIYPGVDAVFYGDRRQLEYDFVVAPGADPEQIRLKVKGATPGVDPLGNIVLRFAGGVLALKKPVVFQNIGGRKTIVEGSYILARNTVRFRLGRYDRNEPLVIDPVFTYFTYLGGSSVDRIGSITAVGQVFSPSQALAIDSAGNVYVTGETLSTDFPLANAGQSSTKTTGYSAFVSALNSTGTALLYSTYLGGSLSGGTPGSDIASGIAWDAADNAVYVVGTASNFDFPTTAGAFQTKNPSGHFYPFVAKFNASGQLTNSTLLGAGSPGSELGLSVAADSTGQAYVTGFTQYSNCTPQTLQNCFPTTPGAVIQGSSVTAGSNGGNGFVAVLNPSLSTLLYSTLLGDPNGMSTGYATEVFSVAVDPSGNFYVVGQTGASTLPVTAGAFQKTLVQSSAIPVAGFAARFGPASKGAPLIYLTYLEATGSGFTDIANGVAADSQGNAYIGGYTHSPTFPVTSGAIQNVCDPGVFPYNCAFVTKLNPAGTGIVWSTFVEPASFLTALQLDTQGNVYVAGNNNGFFKTVNAVEPSLNQGGAFVAKIDPTGGSLLFSSLIGGTDGVGSLALTGLAVDAPGNIYIAGYDRDTTLPTTPGAFQPGLKAPGTGNSYDGFIAKINVAPTVLSGGVVPVYSSSTAITPGEWASIYGTGLAAGTTVWTGNFPTSLGGTSVTINGQPAYLSLASPTQINFQAPADSTVGSVPLVINTVNGSVSATVALAQLSPSLFLLDSRHVAGIILRQNGSGAYGGGTYDIVGPTGSSLGYPTVAAKAGDSVVLFGTGFGPTSPVVPPGHAFSGAAMTTNPVTLTLGKTTVTPSFAGLSGAGVDQFNLTLPASLGTGDIPLTAIVGGVSTQSNVVISVQ